MEKQNVKSSKKIKLTYVGPCDRFVDEKTGLEWKRGESLVVELDVAERLLVFSTKFKSGKANDEDQLAVPAVKDQEDVIVTPGFETVLGG